MSGLAVRTILALALLFAGTGIAASFEFNFDTVAAKTGAPVKSYVDRANIQYREIVLPSGVTFREETLNGRSHVIAVDDSGRGAVFCGWELMSRFWALVETCSPLDDRERELKQDVEAGLERTIDFIVANHIGPATTRDALERGLRTRRFRSQTAFEATPAAGRPQACAQMRGEDLIIDRYKDKPRGEFTAMLDRMLGLPRPPVLHPCP